MVSPFSGQMNLPAGKRGDGFKGETREMASLGAQTARK
jgi:hypothetical protein